MPAFTHTKVDTNKLNISSGNIENSLVMAEKALRTLDQTFNDDLKRSWSSDAGSQFFAQYTNDLPGITSLISRLRTLNNQLAQSVIVYDKADSEANSLVNSLRMD
jgi:WXG100 family type VII secretion target